MASLRTISILIVCVLAFAHLGAGKEDKNSFHDSMFRNLSSEPNTEIPAANSCITLPSDPAGMNYDTLTASEKLQRFSEGVCSPVLLLPGIEGTKLQVFIDCDTLQASEPTIFDACGWNTCEDNIPSWEVWKIKPDPMYTMWVPDLLTPMDFIANAVDPHCFGELIQLNYNPNETTYSAKYTAPAGITMKWYGEGQSDQECGANSIQDLGTTPGLASSLVYFGNLLTQLKSMGYQIGLNLFTIPYDWRLSPVANAVPHRFQRTLETSYQLNGKKSVIITHSMGNMNTLYNLNEMTQADKDQLVQEYIAVFPPYVGALEAYLVVMGFAYLDPYHLGMDLFSQTLVAKNSSANYDLYPKYSYYFDAEEPYFIELFNRINLESQYDPTTEEGLAWWTENGTGVGYQWFPTPNNTCAISNEQQRTKEYCHITLTNWGTDPVLTVQGTAYSATPSDWEALIKSNVAPLQNQEYSMDIMAEVATDNVGRLYNPNVPYTLIYGAHLTTTHSATYDYSPITKTSEDDFALPSSTVTELGDGTVPGSSSLLGAMKWSWQFENNKTTSAYPDAHPIRIVEYCSVYNDNEHSYNSITENVFEGLYCTCMEKAQSGSDCDHMKALMDPYMYGYLSNLVLNAENPVTLGENSILAYSLTETQLSTIASECQVLNAPASVQTVDQLLGL